MTFMWPLRLKLTFFCQTNIFIWFLDPKKPLKVVSFIILTFLFFLVNLIIYYIFSTLVPKKHIFSTLEVPHGTTWYPFEKYMPINAFDLIFHLMYSILCFWHVVSSKIDANNFLYNFFSDFSDILEIFNKFENS